MVNIETHHKTWVKLAVLIFGDGECRVVFMRLHKNMYENIVKVKVCKDGVVNEFSVGASDIPLFLIL